MYNFRKVIYQIPYDFLKFNFSHFTPQIRLFFVEKGNLQFSDSKSCDGEMNQKNSYFRNMHVNLRPKFSGK